MEPIFDTHISRWISTLKRNSATSGRQFDFALWAPYLTFDVLSDIAFCHSLGFIDAGRDIGRLIHSFHEGMQTFGFLGAMYPFTNWLRSTRLGERYMIPSSNINTGWGHLMRVRDRLLQKRRDALAANKALSRTDFLQTLLSVLDENDNPLPDDIIKGELTLIIMAGTDTTGTAMRSIVHLLLTHSDVYAKLMTEIAAAAVAGLLSPIPSYEEVNQHLPYYIACIKEALRFLPPAPSVFPRLIGRDGIKLHGHYIPEGTEVACNPHTVNRDSRVYGEDAELFRPERWLDVPERAKEYEKYSMTFGYGTRTCLGKDVATMELLKGPLQFFREFEAEVTHKKGLWRYTNLGGIGIWEDIWLKIRPRELANFSRG